jgi:hypothetical protein
MAVKLKRRNTGGALVPGTAPLATGAGGVQSGEPVYDATADILYIGKGDDGSGNSTAISAIGGSGAFVKTSQVGTASGVASLDGTGKLPSSQLPASVTGAMVYQGVWNASTNSPTLVSSTGTKGYFYKVSVAGTTSIDGNANWLIGDIITFDGTTWDKIDGPAEAVSSVAGRIGAVTLTTADLTDAGTVGKTLMQATTAAAAKTALSIAAADVSGLAAAASAAAPVQSVASRTGAITLTHSDITDWTSTVNAALAGFAPTAIDGGVI